MAEYWKSQPKKFCDFCKCWIADNKASVDFHEKGKKHQENVKLRIDEVKKKGSERRQQNDQLSDDLAAIEAAALKAYRKDLGYSDVPKPELPKTDLESKQEIKPTESCTANETSASTNIDLWSAYQSPEGYWYYYNSETAETTWDPPQGFQIPDQSTQEQTDHIKESNQLTEDQTTTKNVSGPFGAWETVAVYDSVATKQEEADEKIKSEEAVVKFKEKTMPSGKIATSSDSVGFKKRKSNQGKMRNIRQRTDS